MFIYIYKTIPLKGKISNFRGVLGIKISPLSIKKFFQDSRYTKKECSSSVIFEFFSKYYAYIENTKRFTAFVLVYIRQQCLRNTILANESTYVN